MKKMLVVLLFSAFLLNGCGSGESKANTDEAPKVLDVKLTGPEKVKPETALLMKQPYHTVMKL